MLKYHEKFGREPDFYVRYRMTPGKQGGRRTPCYQHIKWDWLFDGDSVQCLTRIWPEILARDGSAYPADMPIPDEGYASMWIVTSDKIEQYMKRLAPGIQGHFHEGPRRVAECVVIRKTDIE